MPRKLANKPHTSGTKLNWIINQQSTAIEATFQKLHQVLMIIQPKKSKIQLHTLSYYQSIPRWHPQKEKYPNYSVPKQTSS